ncbi:alpha/beta hydrolase, partial [Thiocapsa sp.]|uniref:alpha/beta hydrolase n=1 Tax=Thiocapsa sp. TaxID=2024551 RepID=UPI003594295C
MGGTIVASIWTKGIAALISAFMLTACASPEIVESRNPSTPSPDLGVDHARMDDGYRLPLRVWTGAERPRMIVLGLHGFNDYANAFAPLGRELAAAGITTYAVDQRGFGAAALPGDIETGIRMAR